ncbi:hypothetical protein BH10ACT9_BH10ACT9_59160 [soil metagenome]
MRPREDPWHRCTGPPPSWWAPRLASCVMRCRAGCRRSSRTEDQQTAHRFKGTGVQRIGVPRYPAISFTIGDALRSEKAWCAAATGNTSTEQQVPRSAKQPARPVNSSTALGLSAPTTTSCSASPAWANILGKSFGVGINHTSTSVASSLRLTSNSHASGSQPGGISTIRAAFRCRVATRAADSITSASPTSSITATTHRSLVAGYTELRCRTMTIGELATCANRLASEYPPISPPEEASLADKHTREAVRDSSANTCAGSPLTTLVSTHNRLQLNPIASFTILRARRAREDLVLTSESCASAIATKRTEVPRRTASSAAHNPASSDVAEPSMPTMIGAATGFMTGLQFVGRTVFT